MLENIKPERVFYYFEEISRIPRPSYHEKEISDYLVSFAKDHGLEYIQDELYNVMIIKSASAGYEDKPAIVIQGHMDMVCEKTSDCQKDMEHEGIELVLEGDILSARGTTLGGDDGIAVAYALALLEDDTLKHPRLEVVITVSEEVGMDGARGIDVSPLQGRIFLNIDSELEGQCLASCAGGGTCHISLPINREDEKNLVLDGHSIDIAPEAVYSDKKTYRISVLGGKGGHSGAEIHMGRANATVLLGRVLREIDLACDWRLVSLTGGNKDNAIPREAHAIIMTDEVNKLTGVIDRLDNAISKEFSATDQMLHLSCEEAVCDVKPMTKESTKRSLLLLSSLPNGVRRMSRDIEGLVETSLNLGITSTDEKKLMLGFSLRSSVASAYDALKKKVTFVAEGLGAVVEMRGEYPAWEYVADSPLREKMIEIYRDMTGKELKVLAIHAGLECGIFAGKLPGLDAVSFGPDIWDIHTPDEHLSVSSVERVYRFIRRIIEEL